MIVLPIFSQQDQATYSADTTKTRCGKIHQFCLQPLRICGIEVQMGVVSVRLLPTRTEAPMTSTTEANDTIKVPEMVERAARIIDPRGWSALDQSKSEGWPDDSKARTLEAAQPSIDKAQHIIAVTKSEPMSVSNTGGSILYLIPAAAASWLAYKSFMGPPSKMDTIFVGVLAVVIAVDALRKVFRPATGASQ